MNTAEIHALNSHSLPPPGPVGAAARRRRDARPAGDTPCGATAVRPSLLAWHALRPLALGEHRRQALQPRLPLLLLTRRCAQRAGAARPRRRRSRVVRRLRSPRRGLALWRAQPRARAAATAAAAAFAARRRPRSLSWRMAASCSALFLRHRLAGARRLAARALGVARRDLAARPRPGGASRREGFLLATLCQGFKR